MKKIKLFISAGLFLFFAKAGAQTYDFSQVEQLLQDSVNTIKGLGGGCALVIYKDDKLVYSKSFGNNYSVTKVVPVASASKWLSGALVMALVDEGVFSLDDTVGRFLPQFTGAKGRTTIRQLFSLTAGYPNSSDYHADRSLTLQQCMDSLAWNDPLITAPGTAFIYGGASMQVAGGMAEAATGKSWDTLFAQKITQPLGLGSTDFNGLGVTDNPQVAGGARSSAMEYAVFLRMLLNGGNWNSQQVLSGQAITEMQKDQTNGALIVYSPYAGYDHLFPGAGQTRYGIGQWREVVNSGVAEELSSQGAFGFSPWIDKKRNVAAVLSVFSSFEKVAPIYFELKKRVHAALDEAMGVQVPGTAQPVLYPNPAEKRLHIEVQHPATAMIFDLQGKELLRADVSNMAAELDISSLAAGTYLVTVTGKDSSEQYRSRLVVR